jgi:hypothetical protein
MKKKIYGIDEIELRIKFDMIKSKYISIYGESIFLKCTTCKGTGLFTEKDVNHKFWDCDSFCSECNGYGGMFVLGEIIFECNECKDKREKFQCKKCRGSRFNDWIENIVGKPVNFISSVDDDFYNSRILNGYKSNKVPWAWSGI